jgi:hypothetical protein
MTLFTVGLNCPGPNHLGPATMGWQPTAEAGELAHGAQGCGGRPYPATTGAEGDGGSGLGH